MFCKHDWQVLSETTTESKFEHAMKVLKPSVEGKFTIPGQMSDADRKHIQVFTCSKCGKLKRFVENI